MKQILLMSFLLKSVLTAVVLSTLAGCAIEATEPSASSSDEIVKAPPAAEVVTSFDASTGALPEGLALRDGKAYVGFAPTGEIVEIDLASGARRSFATLPHPVPNAGFMTGLAFDGAGTLFAALVSFDPSVKAGIYAVPKNGGAATLYAEHAEMAFPNGIVFDRDAGMLVTDSAKGAVFQVTKGHAEIWIEGDALRGAKDFCGVGVGAAFDIGANGIAIRGRDVIIANNDKASLVRVPIAKDGSAGTLAMLADTNCDRLGGADGIAIDKNGDVIVALNRLDRVVRVKKSSKAGEGASPTMETVAEGGHLDFPASPAFDARGNLFVTSFALARASSGGDAHPALVRIAK